MAGVQQKRVGNPDGQPCHNLHASDLVTGSEQHLALETRHATTKTVSQIQPAGACLQNLIIRVLRMSGGGPVRDADRDRYVSARVRLGK